ncbi:MAG: hypothetical protein GMKNLPBB_00334 [Myxococcota bacterium]|nr:hypothetical protein [Myxococcota bacterium]
MNWLSGEFWNYSVLGNPLRDWLHALGIFAASIALLIIIRKVVIGRLKKIAESTSTLLDDAIYDSISKTRMFFQLTIAAYPALAYLRFPERAEAILSQVILIVVIIQSGLWITATINFFVDHHSGEEADPSRGTMINLLGFVGRVALWTAVFLVVLSNLGVNITALVTGLGVGGIAVALAVQNILGDLLASLSIVLDRPFVVGDVIMVDTFIGTVEHVGLKTTRVRAISGEQLVMSNADLLKSRIRNFQRLKERRAVHLIGVVYQTPPEKLRMLPGLLKQAAEGKELVRFDRAHFKEFGASSLNFELVYWVESPDYAVFMDKQQEVNFAVVRLLREHGIEFAYPTQTLYVNNIKTE